MNINALNYNKMIKELNKYDIFAFDKYLDKEKSIINQEKQSIKKYLTISSNKDFKQLIKKIKKNKLISIDLETTSLNPMLAKIVGVSLSFKKIQLIIYPLYSP